MKIAFSCTGERISDSLDPRFGRCSYFIIYDEKSGDSKAVENRGQHSGGGAGIAAAQQVIDEKVNVVITRNMGPNAFDLMKESGIKVYKGKQTSCQENFSLFEKSELNEIKEAGPAHGGMGKGFQGGKG